MFDLGGKVALVTGATGGIGSAIARALHGQGATVGLTGTREAVLAELAGALGERTDVFPADLSAPDAADSLVEACEEKLGPIGILVNNAGRTRDGLLVRMQDADWQKVIDVNLSAQFRLTRAVMRGMMRRKAGRIIGISSVVGATGNAGQANYAASKAGMIGFSKAIAQEVAARGITVNCIAPGFIQTPMTDALNEKQREAVLGRIPAGSFGKPEDIAAAVVYLASDESNYMTGQTLHVNGGMAMI